MTVQPSASVSESFQLKTISGALFSYICNKSLIRLNISHKYTKQYLLLEGLKGLFSEEDTPANFSIPEPGQKNGRSIKLPMQKHSKNKKERLCSGSAMFLLWFRNISETKKIPVIADRQI